MEDEVFCCQSQEEEEEPQFYDARDDISSSSEPSSSSPLPFQLSIHALDLQSGFFGGKLDSVEERRQRFMAWMLSNSMFSPRADLRIFLKEDEIVKSGEMSTSGDTPRGLQKIGVVERKHRHIVDVARTFLFEKGFPHSEKSGEMIESSDSSVSEHRRITDPGNEKVLITNSRTNSEEVPIMREDNLSTSSTESTKWRRNKWLRRFGIAACIMDGEEDEDSEISSSSKDLFSKNQIHRVKVRLYRKPSKEFSGVFSSQEIRAHKGAILVMKFSPDGRLLATGGEDGIVRVWSMMMHQWNFEDDLLSLYLSPNKKSDPSPIYIEKDEKLRSWKIMRRNQDSACIVIPPDICRISEEPIQEFVGHSGEILDLCWSKNNVLLSSSMDKTARVWQVGSDSPGKIFSHGNYVTCVQFNPEDESYFISGSIDGKIRIWEISSRHVVNWIDVREIVTAACFDPSGKGIVVGTISGRCLFYDSSGPRLELVSAVLIQGKKKSASNRITGFQFCPTDSRKLLVTSSDSQVRILEDHTVVCKFKGIRNSGSQISATFTEDGRYVVSGSEDSHVYIWNTEGRKRGAIAYEKFPAAGSSIAVSWPLTSPPATLRRLCLTFSGDFPPTQNSFCEFLKGSATWPEEKLPAVAPLGKAQRKALRRSLTTAPPHAWGRVIVTGGLDGRLRSFHNYGLPAQA